MIIAFDWNVKPQTKPNPTKRKLGECLLILSLPGKALKRLVDIARLANKRTQILTHSKDTKYLLTTHVN